MSELSDVSLYFIRLHIASVPGRDVIVVLYRICTAFVDKVAFFKFISNVPFLRPTKTDEMPDVDIREVCEVALSVGEVLNC